jgi:hypothetical protein
MPNPGPRGQCTRKPAFTVLPARTSAEEAAMPLKESAQKHEAEGDRPADADE